MLDLQSIEQRANARTDATPANPANRLIETTIADDSSVSQLATLAGVAAEVAFVDDDRVTCGQCSHFVETRRLCMNHRAAAVGRELGLTLSTLKQRCPGFRRRSQS